jgi:hydroxymethylpyrimidine pyrophosphatase-like HAD family hydrolase
MIKHIRIFDMDGTIVCSLHRYRTVIGDNGERIDLDHWRANEYRAFDDSLLPLANQYKKDIANPETYVIIATARVLNTPDMQFIREKLGEPDYIISRTKDSTVSGGLLKVNGLRQLFNLKQFQGIEDIIFYEDNVAYLKKVCDALNITGVYIPSKQGH